MPSVSGRQQRLFGLALAIKRGKRTKAGGAAKKIARTVSEGTIKEFTGKVAR